MEPLLMSRMTSEPIRCGYRPPYHPTGSQNKASVGVPRAVLGSGSGPGPGRGDSCGSGKCGGGGRTGRMKSLQIIRPGGRTES